MTGSRIYAVRIAGYGLLDADEVGVGAGAATPSNYATSPDGTTLLRRFATARPTSDAEGLWLPTLAELPNELVWGVNPRTGESVTSTLRFALIPDATTRPLFLRSGWRKAANLTTALSSSDTTIYLDDGGAAENRHIWLGSECIQLRTHNGGGEYDCYRGRLGTLATAHGVGLGDEVEVFFAEHGHNLPGRLCELTVVDGDTTSPLADAETILWRGVVRKAEKPGDLIVFEAASLLDLVREGRVLRSMWRGVGVNYVADEFGEQNTFRLLRRADNRFLQVRTPHFAGASTVISDGERIVAVPAIVADRVSDAAVWDAALALPLARTRPPEGLGDIDEVWEVLPIGATTGGSVTAGAADDAHPENDLPLSDDPYTLLLQLLTTTDDGGNGSYDVGPARGLGLGLRHDLIDTATFLQLSTLFGGVLRQRDLVLGLSGEPESLWDLQRALLGPAFQCLGTAADGKITVIQYKDSNIVYEGTAFDDDDVPLDADAPSLDPIRVRPASSVEVRYGGGTGQGERTLPVQAPGVRSRWPVGYTDEIRLDLRGETDDVRAFRLGLAVAARATWTVAAVDVDAMPDLSLWPGDYARVTLADIPAADGEGSMASEGCMVVERAYTLDPWSARYTFLRTSTVRDNRLAGIHLAARVSSYSAPTATIAANAFVQTSHPAGWDQDSDAWAAALALSGVGTIAVDILDSDLSLRGTATVTAAGANTLTLSSPSVSPVANDVIVPTDYDAAEGVDEELFSFFVYMADADGTLGTDNDRAYAWGF